MFTTLSVNDRTASFSTSIDSTSLKVVSTLVQGSSRVAEKVSLGQVCIGARVVSTRISNCKPERM
jgi:hypothetical protein